MADYSPTGYWAHYGVIGNGAPLIQETLPVVSFEESSNGNTYAMVCTRRGTLDRAVSLKKFLHVSPSPAR